jgi:hypothetical protein
MSTEVEELEEMMIKAGRGKREALSARETPIESEKLKNEIRLPVRNEKRRTSVADATVAVRTARGLKNRVKQILDTFGSDIDDDSFEEDPQVSALSRRTLN